MLNISASSSIFLSIAWWFNLGESHDQYMGESREWCLAGLCSLVNFLIVSSRSFTLLCWSAILFVKLRISFSNWTWLCAESTLSLSFYISNLLFSLSRESNSYYRLLNCAFKAIIWAEASLSLPLYSLWKVECSSILSISIPSNSEILPFKLSFSSLNWSVSWFLLPISSYSLLFF